jgi:hypothetical protein
MASLITASRFLVVFTFMLSFYSRFTIVFAFRDTWMIHTALTRGVCIVHLGKINGTRLLSTKALRVLWARKRRPSNYVQSIFRVI